MGYGLAVLPRRSTLPTQSCSSFLRTVAPLADLFLATFGTMGRLELPVDILDDEGVGLARPSTKLLNKMKLSESEPEVMDALERAVTTRMPTGTHPSHILSYSRQSSLTKG